MSKYARPIFRFDDFEEIDESWRGGSFIGGLGGVEGDAGIARQYRAAADALLGQAVRDDSVWAIVLPALFLYRHAIEVRLKAILKPTKLNHDVQKLVTELDHRLREKRRLSLPEELLERIAEIDSMDHRADAFRFSADKDQKLHFEGEVWVELTYLRDVVGWIEEELSRAETLLAG